MFGLSPPWFGDVGRGVLREYAIVKIDGIFNIPNSINMKDACCFGATGILLLLLFVILNFNLIKLIFDQE